MVFTQLCFIVVTALFVEWLLKRIYTYICRFLRKKNGESYSSTSYKRLSTDVTYTIHQQVVDMATLKGITLKEYVLGAIMARLKLDNKRMITAR